MKKPVTNPNKPGKAVKALLNFLHKEMRGHSITILLQSSNLNVPTEIFTCAQDLDRHYIPSRYPNVYDQGAVSVFMIIRGVYRHGWWGDGF